MSGWASSGAVGVAGHDTPAHSAVSEEEETRISQGALPVLLDGGIGPAELVDVSLGHRTLVLSNQASQRLDASRATLLELLANGTQVYGASSGIADLRTTEIDHAASERMQLNIIRSHCCGVGEALPSPIVRGAIALRAATFSRGHSGVRPSVVELLVQMINRDVTPLVPAHGSVGASGDLVLLAHVALVTVGEGEARVADGSVRSGREALASAGLEPLRLGTREGLAMVNGLDFSIAATALLVPRARRLLGWADGLSALVLDLMAGSLEPFLERVQSVRGEGAHRAVARRVRSLCAGSELARTGAPEEGPQDAYCLRCTPLIHGASWEILEASERLLERELSATIDNPLIFLDEGAVYHCGHFHGQALAMAADNLAIGLVNIANAAQARMSLLFRGGRGLPRLLSENAGEEHGPFMLETSGASLVARCRAEAAPISVQSIPVTAEQEDHVSMSWEAVCRTDRLLDHVISVVAMEAAAAQAAACIRGPDRLAAGTRAIYDRLTAVAPPPQRDWPLSQGLADISDLLRRADCPGTEDDYWLAGPTEALA